MATAAIPGFQGQVMVSTDGVNYTKLCELREVTITVERDTIDATSHCSAGWKENILGNAQWSASADALYVDGDANQTAVYDALINRTDLYFKFQPTGETPQAGDTLWSGIGIITSWELSLPNDDAAAVSVEILGKGALTKSTA